MGTHVARGSSRMPLCMECCWQGAVWGQQQVLIPEAWLLSPLFSQEACLQQGGRVQ